MGRWLAMIPRSLRRALAWAAGFLVLALEIYRRGRAAGKADAKVKRLEDDAAAHGRMNDADLGIGANDADNVRWLRDFHRKHGG